MLSAQLLPMAACLSALYSHPCACDSVFGRALFPSSPTCDPFHYILRISSPPSVIRSSRDSNTNKQTKSRPDGPHTLTQVKNSLYVNLKLAFSKFFNHVLFRNIIAWENPHPGLPLLFSTLRLLGYRMLNLLLSVCAVPHNNCAPPEKPSIAPSP